MKYKLTDDIISMPQGKKLHRIMALKGFSDVEEGDVGGYVEGFHNLSHFGRCWIYGNAYVYDNAIVRDDARIGGYAQAYENAIIMDNASVWGKARIHGSAIILGDMQTNMNGVYNSETNYTKLVLCQRCGSHFKEKDIFTVQTLMRKIESVTTCTRLYGGTRGVYKLCRRCKNIIAPIVSYHSFNYTPAVINEPPGKYNMGVELEYEIPEPDTFKTEVLNRIYADLLETQMEDSWYLKHDGSLSYGLEMVSFPLNYNTWMVKNMDELLNRLSSYLAVKKTCGMHIHVSRRCMGELTYKKTSRFCYKYRLFLMAFSKRLNDFEQINDGMIKSLKHYRFDIPTGGIEYQGSKYYALAKRENTYEFRFYKSTLDPNVFYDNLTFTFFIIKFLKTKTYSQILYSKCLINDFMSYVKDNTDRQSLITRLEATLLMAEHLKDFKEHTVFVPQSLKV